MMRRCAALALLALALALSGGCALLPSTKPGATPGAVAPAAPAVELEITAPAELKTLLERHLDLSRLGSLAQGQAVGASELSRLIDATPSQVRDLLQTEGYFAPEVSITREAAAAADSPEKVLLRLQPGPRTVVARADIEVQGALSRAIDTGDASARQTLAALRAAWPLKAGAAFRNPGWSDAKSSVLARLRAAGYAAATLSGSAVDIDTTQHSARLFVVADSGPLFRSGEIDIEGLELHDRTTVLQLAAFGPGTPVTEMLLLDFQDRLQKSGLFERASVALDPNPEHADAAHIKVHLAESSLHQLTTGLGYSANVGPRVTLEHYYRRVFGFAATARNKFEWATKRQAWDGELSTHTGKGLYRNLVGGAVERLESDTDTVLSQRIRAGRTQDSPRIERLYFAEAERSVRTTALARTESVATSLNYHWTWRDIDHPILPTKGFTWQLQGGAGHARDSSGTSGAFGRVYGRVIGYLPFAESWYGQARLEVGNIFAPSQVEVPDSMRFRAGGDDSVRGYEYRSLGPVNDGAVSGGNALLTASVEVARPILESMPSLWGAVFVDAGNASASFKDYKAVLGVGVGLRWRSPVGPLRVDLAYAPDLNRARLHVSVGIVY